jgi:glycosyltransferase involved in cell wall biosynthesis
VADAGQMRFSVAIPTLARPETLRETLHSVLACDPPAGEVIVVDADPKETGAAVAASYGDRVRVLPSPRGLTIQRNRALDAAAGDVIVFLDDDVQVEPGLFAGLAATFLDPTIVAATGRIIEPNLGRRGGTGSLLRDLVLRGPEGRFTRAGYPRRLTRVEREADVEFMQGCFMSVRRELASRVRFDEELADYGLGEDEDFAYRVSRHGRIRYVPSLRVVHKNLGFSSKDQRAFGRMVIRNRSYIFRKNFPQTPAARAEFAWLVLVLVAHRLVNREWRGALGLVEGAAGQFDYRGAAAGSRD